MIFRQSLLSAFSFAVLLATQPFVSANAQSTEFTESGFLEDYSVLTPDPERPGVSMYFAPGVKFSDYDKVMIADIILFLHPDSEYQGISSRKISEITGEFRAYAMQNMEPRREVVTEITPGDNVIVFRAAISNVYAKRPQRGVIGYTPIGVARTGIKKAAGSDYVLSNAALEVEAIDGQTGETLAMLVATRLGENLEKVRSGERKWSDIQKELRGFADTMRDQFRGE